MALNLADLRNHYAELEARLAELQNQDDKTGDAAAEIDTCITDMERTAADIVRAERLENVQTTMSAPVRKTQPEGATAKRKPTQFADDNEFFRAVAYASIYNQRDPRLVIKNTTGDLMQEGGASGGADGGYLLPTDKRELQKLLVPEGSIHGLTDILTTPSNAVTLPTDEDPVWSTAGAAADVSEGNALTEGKYAFKSLDLTLVKKGALVRVTSEMLEDGTNIGSYVLAKTAQKLEWALSKMAFAAFLASGGKVTIAKTSGAQAGSAPDYANVQDMWTAMLVQHRANAIWIANPQLETVLQGYTISGANSGVFPVYIPAGGISDAPYAKLYGRPLIYSELCPAVGTEGDLMLVNPQTFFTVLKAGGPRSDVSIHSEFAKDIVAFRSYVRAVCASKFQAKITRNDGTDAGNVITVGSRS